MGKKSPPEKEARLKDKIQTLKAENLELERTISFLNVDVNNANNKFRNIVDTITEHTEYWVSARDVNDRVVMQAPSLTYRRDDGEMQITGIFVLKKDELPKYIRWFEIRDKSHKVLHTPEQQAEHSIVLTEADILTVNLTLPYEKYFGLV